MISMPPMCGIFFLKGVMTLAATRLIPMRKNKGKSIGACLHNHTSYIQNPDKTEQGELVSSYQCSPLTVDEEFLLTKRLYEQTTGCSQKSDVIAYQVRQSFKPGEVTPEEARQLERGVMVDGRKTARAKVHILSVQNLFTDMIITIHEGRNRQVRKMVEQIGHQVVMLRRIRFGPLKLGELPRGMWRPLTQEELDALKKL